MNRKEVIELAKWKELYQSLSKRFESMDNTINEQRATIVSLRHNLSSAEKAAEISKSSLITSVTGSNSKEQEYIGVINKLKAKIREMGHHGDFDNLGE